MPRCIALLVNVSRLSVGQRVKVRQLTVLRQIRPGTHPRAAAEPPQLALAAALQELAIAVQPPLRYPLVHAVPLFRIPVHKPLESVDARARRDALNTGEPNGRVRGADAWEGCAVGTHAEGLADDGREVW